MQLRLLPGAGTAPGDLGVPRLDRSCRFRLALDIRRYFASVHHETLLGLYAYRLRDPRTLALLRLLIESGGAVYRSKLAVQILDLENDPLPPGCGLPLVGI